MDAVANHLGVDLSQKRELEELEKDVPAEKVLKEIENRLKVLPEKQ